jgi:hypothetical protein
MSVRDPMERVQPFAAEGGPRVLVVLPLGGRSVTRTGWLRQLGPYQSRPN